MSVRTRRSAAGVLVLALTAVLAACSSGTDASSTGSASATATDAQEDATTVRIAELSTANYLTLGRASGLVDDALESVGASADWLGPFTTPTTAYETVYGGQADTGSTGASRQIIWASEDRDILAYAVESYSGDSQGLTAAPGSGVTELADLYGKKVAVGPAEGGTGDYIFEKAFAAAGLDSSQVEKVYIADSDAAAAFATGEIAAWSTYDQFFATAQATEGATVLARGDEIGSHNASIHFVTRAFAEAHPVVVEALFSGLQAQAEAAADDPSVITDAYTAAGASADVVDVIGTFDVPTITAVDADALANLEALAQDYVDFGFIDAVPDLTTAVLDVTEAD
ncbi:MAG TPA: ABC transporter substrate-binding protein [Cellulomonas sp.]